MRRVNLEPKITLYTLSRQVVTISGATQQLIEELRSEPPHPQSIIAIQLNLNNWLLRQNTRCTKLVDLFINRIEISRILFGLFIYQKSPEVYKPALNCRTTQIFVA